MDCRFRSVTAALAPRKHSESNRLWRVRDSGFAMNFSRISNETLLGRVLRFPLRFIPPEMSMPIVQGRLRGTRWIVGTGVHGHWLGSYEYNTRRVFEKTVSKGGIVFDIGANVGFYTLLASVLVGPQGRVFAFEPVPSNLFYLRKHLRINAITNVEVIEAAVSECGGTASFEEGPTSRRGHISSQGKLQVKTVSLDELILRGETPVPDYIKMDVEGGEMLVLWGAKSMLANRRPTLFLTTHGPSLHQQSCQFLDSLGYQLEEIVHDGGIERELLARCKEGRGASEPSLKNA